MSPLQRVLDPVRLKLVVELARHGSITHAADACQMGQPSASAHLRTLEAAAGIRLYERTPRGTRLTDAGRLLARQAAAVLATLDELDQGLRTIGDGLAGTLRLAVCEEFGTYALPRVLAGFVAERPQADVRVRSASSRDVARLVAVGESELGVAGDVRRPEGVVSQPLMREELVGVTRARGPAPDLEVATLIVRPEGSGTRAAVERWLDAWTLQPARILEVDSVEAIKQVVAAGIGVAFLSRMAVAPELARGELHAFVSGPDAPTRRLDIVRVAGRRPTGLGGAFERALRGSGRRETVSSLADAAR